MFDVDEKLLVCNARYLEICGLTGEQVPPGTPFSEIVRLLGQRAEARDFSSDGFWQGAKRRVPQILKLANGRVISILCTPIKDGGWVATQEDVTEQKRAERLLAEKAAELEAMNLRFDAALNNMSQGLCMFDASSGSSLRTPGMRISITLHRTTLSLVRR